MKEVDFRLLSLSRDAAAEMRTQGYKPLGLPVLEKDALVTEVFHTLAKAFEPISDYELVFCGGTALSKGYQILDRMSEDVDFKIIRSDANQAVSKSRLRRDLSEIKHLVVSALGEVGYADDALKVRARNNNQHIAIDAYYQTLSKRNSTLRPHIEVELTSTNLQMQPEMNQVGLMIDSWVSSDYPQHDVKCIALSEAVAEKLIAFPRRLAHFVRRRKRGFEGRFDSTLVRHLYDVSRVLGGDNNLRLSGLADEIRPLLALLIIKDGEEFAAQHPEFVATPTKELTLAMELAKRSRVISDGYELFLDSMVYARDTDKPLYREAVGDFNWLLEHSLDCKHPVKASFQSRQNKPN